MHIHQLVEGPEGLLEVVGLFRRRQVQPFAAEVGVVAVFCEVHDVVAVLLFELLQGQGGLAGGEFRGPPPPVQGVEEGVDLVEAVVHVLVAQLAVDQPVQRGAGDLDEPVLHALEPAGREQGHPELQELSPVEAVDHHIEAADEVLEVPIDPIHPLEELGTIEVGLLVDLLDFMQGELEVELGDLVVGDENLLVRERGDRVLQAEQRIEVDVVPVGGEVGVQEAVEVGRQVLAHCGILVLKELEPGKDPGVKGIGVGHGCNLGRDAGGSGSRSGGNQSCPRWAMHFSSTAIGVGRAPISMVVRQGRRAGSTCSKCSRYTRFHVPKSRCMSVRNTVMSTRSSHFAPSASRMAFTLASTPRAWASKSNSVKLPLWSCFSPGTPSSWAPLPGMRGPTPLRKRRSPTRRVRG